jgi:indole-3-glycerol phosphate synthase
MTILDKIITEKRIEVEAQKKQVPVETLTKSRYFNRNCISLKDALTSENSSGIIAEYKRKSPSKGIINNTSLVEDVTTGYSEAGAAGLSILTDNQFFGGSVDDILSVRDVINVPILRKDFMVDEYQILEAKSIGADVILLIAACLDLDTIKNLAYCAKAVGLEILLELHAAEELEKIVDVVDMIGINNRNLKDFKVDLEHSLNLASKLPAGAVKVSESGIDNPDTIKMLRSNEFKGFLIGENFMKTSDPALACSDFINKIKS